MDLTFIGHQSWLVSSGGSHLLLDPILGSNFGHTPGVDFRVYPPRTVDVSSMPRPDAIVLSHEHLDHFSLFSFDTLPRDVPVYIGPLMPACVTDAITALGFRVEVVMPGCPLAIKSLELTLFSGSKNTTLWESRVTQLLVRAPSEPGGPSVFISVDAPPSPAFLESLNTGVIPPVTAVVLANNSQILPPGAKSHGTNLLPIPKRENPNFPGVHVLADLLLDAMADLPNIKNIILCGNGFLNHADQCGPFLYSDNKRLAALANLLTVDGSAYVAGPHPGDVLEIQREGFVDRSADWIKLDAVEMRTLLDRQAAFMSERPKTIATPVTAPWRSLEESSAAMMEIETELGRIATAVLRSRAGTQSLELDQFLSGPLGPRRLLFRFIGAGGGLERQWALDVARASFVEDTTPTERILEVFPMGVEIFGCDFVAMLRGEIQIWEMVGSVRTWFVNDLFDNLIAFLFEHYGEQSRPDLSAKVYTRALERIHTTRHADGR